MTPTSSRSRGPLYRYYISRPATEGRRSEAAGRFRVSAPEIEAVVLDAVGLGDPNARTKAEDSGHPRASTDALAERLRALVLRVTLLAEEVQITLRADENEAAPPPLVVPWPVGHRKARHAIVSPSPDASSDAPMRGAQRARLVQGIANGRRWLNELATGEILDTGAIADREGCSERHVRMVLNLAFLSPTIVKAAVEGTLPAGYGIVTLSDAPAMWAPV